MWELNSGELIGRVPRTRPSSQQGPRATLQRFPFSHFCLVSVELSAGQASGGFLGCWLPSGCRLDTTLVLEGRAVFLCVDDTIDCRHLEDEGGYHLDCDSHLTKHVAKHSVVPDIGQHCSLFCRHSMVQGLESLTMRLTLMDESIDMLSRTHLYILAPE